ncbi:MAG: hypothetical protein ACXWOV_15555, partial [Isosphaeraceae bacterium]
WLARAIDFARGFVGRGHVSLSFLFSDWRTKCGCCAEHRPCPLIDAYTANHDPTVFLEAACRLQSEECSNSQVRTSCLDGSITLRLALRRNRIVHDEARGEQPAIVRNPSIPPAIPSRQ